MEQTQETKPESEAVKAARARVAALRARSNKIDDETAALAALAREESAEVDRLDKEWRESVDAKAQIIESDVRNGMSAEERKTTQITCAYDYPTHFRTGNGIMVVRALGRDAAVLAIKDSNRADGSGVNLYDGSEAAMLRDLLDATLYPDSSTVQKICHESPVFASGVHTQVMMLSGLATRRTAGKSGS